MCYFSVFFFNDTATTEIYTLSLHDALPIYLAILALVLGVNLYILNQFRALTELGAQLATHHFPAVETAKQLITSLYAQLKSDKQYLVLRDTTLLKDFLQEAENFRKTLKALEDQESSGTRLEVLKAVKARHEKFHTLFLSVGVEIGRAHV